MAVLRPDPPPAQPFDVTGRGCPGQRRHIAGGLVGMCYRCSHQFVVSELSPLEPAARKHPLTGWSCINFEEAAHPSTFGASDT